MMTILLNNEPMRVAESCDLLTLLESCLSHSLRPFCAIALNRRFVARERYSQTLLSENDIVDIVVPMQGG
jgi:thiamine biosynthesis protein ThiS